LVVTYSLIKSGVRKASGKGKSKKTARTLEKGPAKRWVWGVVRKTIPQAASLARRDVGEDKLMLAASQGEPSEGR